MMSEGELRLRAPASAPVGSGKGTRLPRVVDRIRSAVPTGHSLPDEVWLRRHRALLLLVALHAPVIFLFALSRGNGIGHSLFESGIVAQIAVFAALAPRLTRNRKVSAASVAVGLLSSSAIIVHLSGGVIEAHFHFFVMMSLLLLYEDLFLYLLAFAYVVLHHGVGGVLDVDSIYSHAAGRENPWKWAAIHGLFISAAGVANVVAWRLNEDVRAQQRDAYRRARASEERFRSAFEDAPIGVAIMGVDERFRQVNSAFSQIVGYSKDDLRELDWRRLVRPGDVDSVSGNLERLLSGAVRTYQLERPYIHADGHVGHGLVSMSLVRDDDDEPAHFLVQLSDISERKRAEQYLEAQRAVASVLAEAPRDHDVFPELLEALGTSLRCDVGMYWAHADDKAVLRLRHVWRAVPAMGSPFEATSRELAFERGRGLPGRVWASGQAACIEDVAKDPNFPRAAVAAADGLRGGIALPILSGTEVLGVVEFFSSEPQRLDAPLTRTMAALSRQIGQFVSRRKAERDADRVKEELLALVSHEFRTPLTSIMGYVEILLEDGSALNEQQRDFLRVVGRNGERLLRLVGDLLFVAEIDAGKLTLEHGPVDTAELVAECDAAARPAAERKQISLSVATEDVFTITGDRARLGQLLDNLVSNALKFTPPGGRVGLRAFASNGHQVLEVSDSGIGISTDEQPRLFQRFFRASGAVAGAIPGTGLGLVIAKGIVDAHGGTISCVSSEQSGTTFRVELPIEQAVPAGDDSGKPSSTLASA